MSRGNPRRGYALIECLVLITVMAVLAGLCAGTIQVLLKLDRSGRSAAEEAVDLARLARDFRDDSHDAPPLDPPGRSNTRILFKLGGSRTVEYEVRPGDILRTVRSFDKVQRFETYKRPARASVRFEVQDDGPRFLATILIDRPSGDRDLSTYRDYRIEAELGKHARQKPRAE